GSAPKLGRLSLRHHKAKDNFLSLALGYFRSTCALSHLQPHSGIIYTKLIADCQRLFWLIHAQTASQLKRKAAKQQAIKAGVDPKLLDQADAQFKQSAALKDLEQKVFKNTGVISGNKALGAEESINVNQAVKELQKLQRE